LKHQRHIGDREDETTEHEKGEDEEKCGHHGLLLCDRDGGDEQADTKDAQQKKTGAGKRGG